MAVSSLGIGSGLDLSSLLSNIMSLERRPIDLLDQKEAGLQAKITAYGSVKGALSTLQSAVSSLTSTASFSALKASVADSTIVTASATSIAATGSYSVEVTDLAKSQKLKSDAFTSVTDTLGSGTITLEFGTYSGGAFTLNPDKATKTVTVASGSNSLSGVRDAINAADVGVQASIINDGTDYRLVLTSKDTGAANALRISVDDDDANNTDTSGLSRLVYDATTGGTTNLTETVAAKNATLIVDGITINKSSNTVTDAIQGVTLNLLKTNTGSTTNITIARDSASIKSSVENFVKAYNDAQSTLKQLSAYDTETKTAAILQGESSLLSIMSQIRNVLNTSLSTAGGGLSTLSEIGVSFQKDGSLTVNSTKLQAAVDNPNKDIATLFASIGKPSDSLVEFVTASSDTKAGRYDLSITQLATQGKVDGSGVAVTTINAGVNDTLTVTVDGNSADVTLSAGTYTAATLAAEIQSKINGASAISDAGSSVTVSESAGVLTITSDRYGSTSNAEVNGGTALSDLFGTPTTTAGLDVAGTINGVAGTGDGQKLSVSGGDAAGLAVKITGGSTGDRGSVAYAQGYAYQLDQLLSQVLSSTGQVASRTDGLTDSITTIGTQREALERRLTATEARYRAQFTALDQLVASMSRTSTFLTQQLATITRTTSSQIR